MTMIETPLSEETMVRANTLLVVRHKHLENEHRVTTVITTVVEDGPVRHKMTVRW